MVLQVFRGQFLASRYWGPRLEDWGDSRGLTFVDRPFEPNPDPADRTFSLDTLPQEYPSFGNTDFRSPAFQVQHEDGSTVSNAVYRSHRILDGKPGLGGLPSVYAEPGEAQTLELTLADLPAGLEIVLTYSVLEDFDAMTRSVRFLNVGSEKLKLLRALSASVDLEEPGLEVLQLSGSWARERHVDRSVLRPGIHGVSSTRGASSHHHNPFLALLAPGAGEDQGSVWAMNLVYSGNFLAQAELSPLGSTRMSIGINPFEFSWLLEPGQEFLTPEAVLVHSAQGLGSMSRTFHRLYRQRLCRGPWRDRVRPVLVNNWEGTYFDFDHDKIVALADQARELGIELLVLDDGWFGRRNDDTTSLGDWVVDRTKLSGGLDALAQQVNDRGLLFGLWFEPEMVSPDSDLYRAHPDWCLHVPGRSRSQGRNQLVLNLGLPEVRDHLVSSISAILSTVPIRYIKWDMNRHQTEVGSPPLGPDRQKETSHRYLLGLYEVLERITTAFPEVLFESCSGGGGRFDPGILAYMPQTWTSDNTDAVSRLKIQWGTSLVYPPVTMGAHVSAVPNHQVGRTTPLSFRGDVACGGNLGFELDLGRLSMVEKESVQVLVDHYKRRRALVQFGDFYRLVSPFESDDAAWGFVAPDQSEAWFFWFRARHEANGPVGFLRFQGLESAGRYALEGEGQGWTGAELMAFGVRLPVLSGDQQSCSWYIKKVDSFR
jgi:alpha-galactosidase